MDDRISKIAEFYGYDAQSRQCIEEMAELTQAINKFWRKVLYCGSAPFPRTNFGIENIQKTKECKQIIEELADVQIMVFQISYLLNVNIEPIIDSKLDRQIERIKNKESEEN